MDHPAVDKLKEIDPDNITPREALEILGKLKDTLKKGDNG